MMILAEAVEPTAFENWLEVLTDFASLKNFIVSIGGLTAISVLFKIRGAYKFFKSPTGQDKLYDIFEKWLGKLTDNPELFTNLLKSVMALPVVKQLLTKFEAKADSYDIELRDKILNLQAKLDAGVFKDNTSRAEAQQLITEYRTKLRDLNVENSE